MKYHPVYAGMLLAIAPCFVAADEHNLIDNPGFENGAERWVMAKPWTVSAGMGRSDSMGATINFDGRPYASVTQSDIPIKPGKYYRLSIWRRMEMKIDNRSANGIFFYAAQPTGGAPIRTYSWQAAFPFWHRMVDYFNSESYDSTQLVFSIDASKTPKGLICLDDAELVELSDGQLKENLVVNPDFEEGENGGFPCGWIDANYAHETKLGKISLDAAAGFIRGKQSLQLDGRSLEKGQNCGVRGCSVPAVPGRDYVLTVWLKAADVGTPAVICVDGWLDNKPYWFKRLDCQVDTEWRKYSIEAHIPGPDDEKFYAPNRLIYPTITLNGNGILWANEVRFTQEQKQEGVAK